MRPKRARGALGVLPVPECHRGTSMHQLADFARGARRETLPQYEHLGARNCPAHRAWAAIHLLRREIGATQDFGETVHQIELRLGLSLPERADSLDRQMTAGIRQDAQGRERSEEHTSELQSRLHLVCRLLLEKKKK